MATTKERRSTGRHERRADEAAAVIGPLGRLFASASTACLLSVFISEPHSPFTVGDLKSRSRASKGAVQTDIRRLLSAKLIHREGQGNQTRYRYAADAELGRAMLIVVRTSQREAQSVSPVPIPWLAELAQPRPVDPSWNPYSDRVEASPSDEATQLVLEAADPAPAARELRTMPGLRTRR
jgi:hypothetical protein